MDKLLAFLNALDPADRPGFGIACGTTEKYLRKAVSAKQIIRPSVCVAIERETAGKVTRKDLRPNDWASIWPELVDAA